MLELLTLPDIVLEKIFSYLNYDDISRYRIVCRQFDALCKQLLNKGFILVEKHHGQCLKAVKSQLPRRESERRSHPLARHCDILTAIETRLSMLAMTFTKYIDAGLCCFIPGKVIDEIFRVLRSLKGPETPPRAHEVLQELRDISSMAMEHFDEKIIPALKLSLASSAHSSYSMTGSCLIASTSSPRILGQEKLRLEFSRIHNRTKENRESVGYLKRSVNNLTLKLKRYGAQLSVQTSKIRQQEVKLAEQATKLTEQDTQIAELKRHIEEWDHKFGDLMAELSRAREESGAIAESGPSHDVESRVHRKLLPAEHIHETESQIGRRKVNTVKRTAAMNIDIVKSGECEERIRSCRNKKRKEVTVTSEVDLKVKNGEYEERNRSCRNKKRKEITVTAEVDLKRKKVMSTKKTV